MGSSCSGPDDQEMASATAPGTSAADSEGSTDPGLTSGDGEPSGTGDTSDNGSDDPSGPGDTSGNASSDPSGPGHTSGNASVDPSDSSDPSSSTSTDTTDSSSTTVPSSTSTDATDAGSTGHSGGGPSGYTRVFYDGFEDGTTNQWTSSSADVTTTQPLRGTYAARSNWNGLVEWNHPERIRGLHLASWPYSQEFLVRFWLRLDGDVDDTPYGTAGGKLFRLPFSNDRDGNEIYWSSSHADIFVLVDDDPVRSIWGCGDLSDREWHQIEIYVKDAADGALRFWVDDEELTCSNSSGDSFPYLGDTHRNDAGWDTFYWPSNWSGADGCCDHDADNHMYLDDVEIFSDSPIGDLANGALADGTAQAG